LSLFSPDFLKFGALTGTLYGLSMMFSKLSILFFYIRYFKLPQKPKMAISAAIIVIVLYSLLGSFEWVLNCQPIERYWDLSITRGSCLVHWQHSIFIFSAAMNTTTDIIILLLSIFMLHGIWLTRQERIALVLVMMMGGLVIVLSIVRLKMIVTASHRDMTWNGVVTTIFWMIEMNLAIICACLPAGKAFLRKHFPSVIGYNNLTSTSSQN
jgi:hypothetical protein